MLHWYSCAVISLLTTILLCTSCAETKDQLPTMQVEGSVSFQGAALESGTITFFPVAGGKHAIGMIGKEGVFMLSTYESGDGAGSRHAQSGHQRIIREAGWRSRP